MDLVGIVGGWGRDALDLLAVLPGMLLTGVILISCAGKTVRVLRRRGWMRGRILAPVVVPLTYVVVFTCIVIVLPTGGLPLVLFAPVAGGGAALLGGALLVATAAVLPAGRRRGPSSRFNRGAAWALGTLAGVVVLGSVPLAIVAWRSVEYTGAVDRLIGVAVCLLIPVVAGGVAILLVLAISSVTGDPPPAGAPPASGGVLFIRPFEGEARPFGDVFGEVYQQAETFEEFLGDAIGRRIGPLVALGDPGERFVRGGGAARTYAPDALWQRKFERLAGDASCVLTHPSLSGSTVWELRRLRELGLQAKLFVCTAPVTVVPPPHDDDVYGAWLLNRLARAAAVLYHGRFRHLPAALLHGSLPPPPDAWTPYAAALRACGYDPGPDPGPGAVLRFDGSGRPAVLLTGAREPARFAEAIARGAPGLTGGGGA